MGTGIETSSHKFGLFQHICRAFEIILCDGSIVKCTKENDPDLFYAIPWSHGTLGFLLSVEIQIVSALKYVKLEYEPVTSLTEACQVFKRQTMKNKDNQFVEGLMFDRERGVIMTGRMRLLGPSCRTPKTSLVFYIFREHGVRGRGAPG